MTPAQQAFRKRVPDCSLLPVYQGDVRRFHVVTPAGHVWGIGRDPGMAFASALDYLDRAVEFTRIVRRTGMQGGVDA